MRTKITFLLLSGLIALSACRSKPKKKSADFPASLAPRLVNSAGFFSPAAPSVSKAPKPSPEIVRPQPEPNPPAVKPPNSTEKPAVSIATPRVPKPAKSGARVKEAGSGAISSAAPIKAVSGTPPAPSQLGLAPLPAGADIGNRSLNQNAPSPRGLPTPSPTLQPAGEQTVPLSLSRSLTDKTSAAPRGGGPGIGLGVSLQPTSAPPATEPFRMPQLTPSPAQAQSPPSGRDLSGLLGGARKSLIQDSPSLSLPTGGGGLTNGKMPEATQSPGLPCGSGTHQSDVTKDPRKPIAVDPLLPEGTGGAAWREQQLARQAAEQKARAEEQGKLKNWLYRFLFRPGTNR